MPKMEEYLMQGYYGWLFRQLSSLNTKLRYVKSFFKQSKYEKDYTTIEKYCFFIGYPRSGHSLVGSLLDAHPNIVIAHELDALRYIKGGFSKKQLFYLLLEKSLHFTKEGREWTGYSYAIPNQWNGKYRELKVIGDKKGGSSNHRLVKNPELLQDLKETVGVDLKIIHVIRNPYDNISTMSKRIGRDLNEGIDDYFFLCKAVTNIKEKINQEDWMDIRHELIIDNPEYWLTRLCQFLEQEVIDDYLKDCASIVYKSPHKSRKKSPWSHELIKRVENEIEKYPFLHGYTFDG
jgi:hypothetical protein